MNKIEKTTYRVCEFVNKDGEVTSNKKEMTVMVVTAITGGRKGISIPRGMSIARRMRLKIGDTFTETIIYEKTES